VDLTAAVVKGPEKVGIEPVAIAAKLKADELLVNTRWAGISGTDAMVAEVGHPPIPIVPGWEAVGVVATCGGDIVTFQPGDVVLVLPPLPCRECEACRGSFPSRCETLESKFFSPSIEAGARTLHRSGYVGGLADEVLCHESQLWKLPNHLAEKPAACMLGYSALAGAGPIFERWDQLEEGTIAVLGCGGVGSCAVLAALAHDKCSVVGVEANPVRRALVSSLGAIAMSPDEAAQHRGTFDLVLDCTTTKSINAALRLTRPKGTCVAIGIPSYDGRLSIDLWQVVLGAKCLAPPYDGRSRSELLAQITAMWDKGQLPLDRLVDRKLRLADVPEALLGFGAREFMKGVVDSGL
jgi:Zn-dependent alcohol dehydrogenase